MKPKLLIRIAAGCLLFFALGHAMGHSSRKDIADEKAQKVIKAMEGYRYNMFGQLRTYDENYTGLSVNLIITLMALVAILWLLSNGVAGSPALIRKLLWPIILCVGGFAITGFLYFFPLPAISCVIALIFLSWAALRLPR